MIEFLLFCIATVGMTSIITQGVIFQPFRQFIGNWAEKIRVHREQRLQNHQVGVNPPVPRRSFIGWLDELINCAQCTGFWCGLFCGLIFVLPELHAIVAFDHILYHLLKWFCCGVGGSFLAALGCNAVEWIFYHKMSVLRRLEAQDLALTARRTEKQEQE